MLKNFPKLDFTKAIKVSRELKQKINNLIQNQENDLQNQIMQKIINDRIIEDRKKNNKLYQQQTQLNIQKTAQDIINDSYDTVKKQNAIELQNRIQNTYNVILNQFYFAISGFGAILNYSIQEDFEVLKKINAEQLYNYALSKADNFVKNLMANVMKNAIENVMENFKENVFKELIQNNIQSNFNYLIENVKTDLVNEIMLGVEQEIKEKEIKPSILNNLPSQGSNASRITESGQPSSNTKNQNTKNYQNNIGNTRK